MGKWADMPLPGLVRDENGTYRRPRGSAPKNKVWDEVVGRWADAHHTMTTASETSRSNSRSSLPLPSYLQDRSLDDRLLLRATEVLPLTSGPSDINTTWAGETALASRATLPQSFGLSSCAL